LAPAIEQVQPSSAAVEQECDVGKRTMIVAVPSSAGADQLARAGVPFPAAKLMAGTDIRGDRWCEVPGDVSAGEASRTVTVCVESTVVLPEVVVVTGTILHMVVIKESDKPSRQARLSKVKVIS
jgi:hypothetical protein